MIGESTSENTSYSKKSKTIMVADDDPAILEVLTIILEDAKYIVNSSSNGKLIQKIRDELPDLILLDIWMSGIDGRQICKNLKSQKLTKHIPIIMISANKDTEQIAKEAGAEGFIAKPFEMNDLLAKVKKYI